MWEIWMPYLFIEISDNYNKIIIINIRLTIWASSLEISGTADGEGSKSSNTKAIYNFWIKSSTQLILTDYYTYRSLKWMHEIMAQQMNKIEHKYCSPRDASCWLDLDAELLLSSDCFVWVEVADSEEEGLADFRLDIISSRLLQNNSSRKIHAPKTDSTLWQGFTVLWATKTKHIEKGGPVSGGTCQKKCPMRVLSNVIYMLFI